MFDQTKKKEIKLIREIVSIIIALKNNLSRHEIDEKISQLFPFFIKTYPLVYEMVLNNDKLDMLTKMFDNLDDICDKKKKLDTVREELAEELAEEYLYPVFGKPEK